MKKLYTLKPGKLLFICLALLLTQSTFAQVLDQLSASAQCGFSLRKLKSSYSGYSINVRRSSDNATADIGFLSSGNLDTASLKSFIGANDGFVAIWYDQSGNGNNATQTTSSVQPQIVNSGVVVRDDQFPAMLYSGGQYMNTPLNLNRTSVPNATVSMVYKSTTNSIGNNAIWGSDNGNYDRLQILYCQDNHALDYGIGNGSTVTKQNNLNTLSKIIYTAIMQNGVSNGSNVYTNGVAGTAYTETVGDAHANLQIGATGTGIFPVHMTNQEFITFYSALSNSDQQKLQDSQSASFNPIPSITSFTPITGGSGTTVTINGKNLLNTSAVSFGGVSAISFNIVSATQITAVVGSGASGSIVLTTPYGTASLAGFSFNTTLGKIGIASQPLSAYSVRTLSNSYNHAAITPPASVSGFTNSTTPLVRVRRASDNASLDIGYTGNGDLDTATLKSFAASTNAFVSVWYDQSGNNNDATQPTAAAQPRLVNAGMIDRDGSRPAMIYSGSQYFNTPINLNRTSVPNASINMVYRSTSNSVGNNAIWGSDNNGYDRLQILFCQDNLSLNYGIGNGSNVTPENGLNNLDQIVYTAIMQNNVANGSNVFINGAGQTAYTETTGDAHANLQIGATGTAIFKNHMKNQEFFCFFNALPTNERVILETNQTNYYFPTIYYSKANGDLSTLSTYGTNSDGTGTAPADFNGSGTNAIYQLANRANYALTNDLAIHSTFNIPGGNSLSLTNYTLTVDSLGSTGKLNGTTHSGLVITSKAGGVAFSTGGQLLKSLFVADNSSLVLGSPLSIADSGYLQVTNNAKLFTRDSLTLLSTAASTAFVKQSGSGTVINGKVIAQRYISDRRAYRLLASPVGGNQTINASYQEGASPNTNPKPGFGTFVTGGSSANGFDQNYANNSSLLIYNTRTGTTTGIANTTFTGINDNQGYFVFVRGNRAININDNTAHSSTTLRFTGPLRVGDQTPVPVDSVGYTMIGNPYSSPIDFGKTTKTNLLNEFYAYDYQLNTVGGYVLVNDVNNTGTYQTTPPSPSGISNIIASGEAFLVTSQPHMLGSLQIVESAKSNQSLTSFSSTKDAIALAKGSSSNDLRVNLQKLGTDNTMHIIDGVLASYASNYSNKVDGMDAGKLTNFNENFSLIRNNQLLTLERRATFKGADTLYIQMSNMEPKAYSIQIDPAKFNVAGTKAYLEDAYLKTSTLIDLKTLTNISFNVTNDVASFDKRFMLTFTAPVVSANSDFASIVQKHVGGTGISVYPNPAIGKQIVLNFNSMPQGKYTVTVVNPYGEQISKQDFNYDGLSSSKSISTTQSGGVYVVVISSANYTHTEKVIVN